MSEGINLRNPSRYPIESDRLVQASTTVLESHPAFRDASLSIVITDTRTIRALNLRYVRVDAPTDVLSFPAVAAPDEVGQPSRYLGDVIIAHDYVSVQAEAVGAALSDILCLLVIHGTLHLLGYEHDTKPAKDKMWAAQDIALHASHIDPAIVDVYGNIQND